MRYLMYCIAAVMLVTGPRTWGEEIQVPYAPAQPDFTIPTAKGLHSVGVRAFAWINKSKTALARSDSTDYREIAVQVWCPATVEDGDRSALYFPELPAMLSAAGCR